MPNFSIFLISKFVSFFIQSAICGVAHSQQREPDLIETIGMRAFKKYIEKKTKHFVLSAESNKLVVINFLENELIDKELFCLNFLDLNEQVIALFDLVSKN